MKTKGVTNLGKKLRKIRIDNDEISSDMARKLEISVSYLSAIENGKRNIPKDLAEKLFKIYQLSDNDKEKILQAISIYSGEMRIRLDSLNEKQQELSLLYAREISKLSDRQIEKITGYLNGKE
ncbi:MULTISPECIES: helix-turn-helix domain-containing protein [Leptotrichia]|uniref:helix-turn-helix domain-containing protein n=1 Tax=Leptotrichia TaxID=32067 RepID=UPI000B1E202F|nr:MULTISPECIES: helix-turn-helix transcriptional regulator [Leptotrichia]DAS50230.1 MAG TPA: helix-turn-helix domain protein [Caudoviricetes sp.]